MITQEAMAWLQQNATTNGTIDWSRLPEAVQATAAAAVGGAQPVPGAAPATQQAAAGISAGMPAPQYVPKAAPISRTYVPYAGDPNTYGMTGGGHNFFEYAPPPPPPVVPVPGVSTPSTSTPTPGAGPGGGLWSVEGNGGGGSDTGGGNSDRGGDAPSGGNPSGGLFGGFDPGRMPGLADYIGKPGATIAGLAIPGVGALNAISNATNTALNYKDLEEMGLSLSPGQVIGGMMGLNSYNSSLDNAMNGAMGTEKGRGALSGKGPSNSDIDAALAAAAAQNVDTALNAPVGAVESQALEGSVGPEGESGSMGGDMGGGFEGGFAGGAGDSPGDGGFQGQRWGGRTGYARGGPVAGISADMPMRGGFIDHRSPGRADRVPMTLPRGSYVVPADVVSGHGEGNSLAGAARLDRMAGGAPRMARGGRLPAPGIKVKVSGGEYAFLPHEVEAIGGGSQRRGAHRLDELVNTVRTDTVHALRKAPKPR